MTLSEPLLERAIEALKRPLLPEELADILWPERSERPVAAKKRAGHIAVRDVNAAGVEVVQNADDTYVRADCTDAYAPPREGPPAAEPELQVDPATGQVVQVQRRTVGRLANEQHTDGELVVENGVVMRLRKEVVGPLPSHAQQQPPYVAPPQQAPVQKPTAHLYAQMDTWAASKGPEMASLAVLWFQAAFFSPDAMTKWRKSEEARVRTLALANEGAAWTRHLGLPEANKWGEYVASFSRPFPAPAPTWPNYGY